jgi:hypothetical protein
LKRRKAMISGRILAFTAHLHQSIKSGSPARGRNFGGNPLRPVGGNTREPAHVDRIELHRTNVPVGGDLGNNLRLTDTPGAPEVRGTRSSAHEAPRTARKASFGGFLFENSRGDGNVPEGVQIAVCDGLCNVCWLEVGERSKARTRLLSSISTSAISERLFST